MAAVAAHVWLVHAPAPEVPASRSFAAGAAPVPAAAAALVTEAPVLLDHLDIVPHVVQEEAPERLRRVIPRNPPLGPTRLAVRDAADGPAPLDTSALLRGGDMPRPSIPSSLADTDQPAVLMALHERPIDLDALPRALLPGVPSLTTPPRPNDMGKAPRAEAAAVAPGRSTASSGEDTQLVLNTVREYRRAYEQLDVKAAKAVYPSLDERELQRAFRRLQGQQLRFTCQEVSIVGQDANARCSGDATYHPKVGSRVVRLTKAEWTFNLLRRDSAWQIADVRLQ
jgi:hypothetical protein